MELHARRGVRSSRGCDAVGEPNQAAIEAKGWRAWRPEMSQKRQPEESDGPRRGGGGGEAGGSSSSSSLPYRPGEPKRPRVALRE